MKIRRIGMSTEIYETVSYICFGTSAVMFFCSIILFWKLDIRGTIGELTGSTAKKAIEELKRKENVYSKNNSGLEKVLRYNERSSDSKGGKITEKIFQTAEDMEGTTPLNITERLMDAEIEDETKLLEEFSSIPIKQVNAGFQITKDEIYVHKENATELLKE